MSALERLVVIGGVVLLVIACFGLYIAAVQWAWNVLVPSVFNGPTIDYVQAAAVAFVLMVVSGGGTKVVRERS